MPSVASAVPGRAAGQHRAQNKALEGRHADVAEAYGSDGGQDLGREPGVLELVEQDQEVHELLRGLGLVQFYGRREQDSWVRFDLLIYN